MISRSRYVVPAVCGLLVLAVLAVYVQTVGHGFAGIDDEDYVFGNRHVRAGLTFESAVWAFTDRQVSYWHPLTWLSLMLDGQLYGAKNPAGFHLTNVLLHAANAVVLFLALRRMTRQIWPSALAAALFAIHPAHVESVAWITERKDVLSGLFGLLAIWAYAWYAERPSAGRYLLVAAALALGLMAKAILATWPLLFLLLDYWPLRRPPRWRLLLEKAPLLLLVAASSLTTFRAQSSVGAVISLGQVPLLDRVARAAVLYVAYLEKTLWPANLAFYRLPPMESHGQPIAAGALLLLLSVIAVWGAWRGWRWLAVGWFWYLGVMVPTIGLVQVGFQVMADRFLYLPQIGLCLAIAWSAARCANILPHGPCSEAADRITTRSVSEVKSARPRSRFALLCASTACSILLAALGAAAWRQAAYWRTTETLWSHALAVNPRNPRAHVALGTTLAEHGDLVAAIDRYERALKIDPDLIEAHYNYGVALVGRRDYQAAIDHFRKALAVKNDWPRAHFNLADALASAGDRGTAIAEYRRALEIKPDYAEAHNNLANELARRGDTEEAIVHFQKALELEPGLAKGHYNFGNALEDAGRLDEAIEQYQKDLAIEPDHASARHNLAVARLRLAEMRKRIDAARQDLRARPRDTVLLNEVGWILATNPNASLRNGTEAIELAQRAIAAAGPSAALLDTLAAAYAESGRFAEAIETEQRAEKLARAENNTALLRDIQGHLKLFTAKKPLREFK